MRQNQATKSEHALKSPANKARVAGNNLCSQSQEGTARVMNEIKSKPKMAEEILSDKELIALSSEAQRLYSTLWNESQRRKTQNVVMTDRDIIRRVFVTQQAIHDIQQELIREGLLDVSHRPEATVTGREAQQAPSSLQLLLRHDFLSVKVERNASLRHEAVAPIAIIVKLPNVLTRNQLNC
jgi:hypothetical protein